MNKANKQNKHTNEHWMLCFFSVKLYPKAKASFTMILNVFKNNSLSSYSKMPWNWGNIKWKEICATFVSYDGQLNISHLDRFAEATKKKIYLQRKV